MTRAGRVQVEVDGRTVEVWSWATVRHALHALDPDVRRRVRDGDLVVTDGHGHPVGLEGRLQDGARLELRPPEDIAR